MVTEPNCGRSKRCKLKKGNLLMNNIKQLILMCSKDLYERVETEVHPGLYLIIRSTTYFNDFTDSIYL